MSAHCVQPPAVESTTLRLGGSLRHPIFRIGVDLDHTLSATNTAWRARFRNRCVAPAPHRPVSPEEVALTWDYWAETCAPCFEDCLTDAAVLLTHKPMLGARPILAALHGANAEMHIITARPDATVETTLEWLERVGLSALFATITFAREKRPTCEVMDLDLLIDDSPHVYAEMTTPTPSPTRLAIFDAPYNRHFDHALRVRSWAETLSLLPPLRASRRPAVGSCVHTICKDFRWP